MTANQIKLQEVEEQQRHNLEDENIKRDDVATKQRGQSMDFASKLMTSLIGKGSRFAKVKGNDPSWYTQYEQLAKDAGTFTFLDPLGTEYENNHFTIGSDGAYNCTQPGIMVLPYVPEFGRMKDISDTANVIGTKLYSFVRHANSGSKNYDIPDLTQYVLAVTNAITLVSVLRQMYGVARKFQVSNKYMGKSLLAQFGVDPEEVYRNMADLRYRINSYTQRLNAFAIPGSFNYLTRALWLNEHIWLDNKEINKAQMYAFLPASYWHYNWKEARLELKSTPILYNNIRQGEYGSFSSISGNIYSKGDINSSVINPLSNWYDLIEDVLIALSHIEDVGIISGDMLKAFKGNTFKLVEIPETYYTDFAFSLEVLEQIHNITPRNIISKVPTSISALTNEELNTPDRKLIALYSMITQYLPGINTSGSYLMHIPEVVYLTDDTNDGTYVNWNKILFGYNAEKKTTILLDSIRSATPSAGDVLVMSRGTNVVTQVSVYDDSAHGTITLDTIDSFGSEIFLYPYVVTFARKYVGTLGNSDYKPEDFYLQYYVIPNGEAFTIEGNGKTWGYTNLPQIVAFEYTPSFFNAFENESMIIYDARSICNATQVHANDLARLHYVAINSLLYIPEINSR